MEGETNQWWGGQLVMMTVVSSFSVTVALLSLLYFILF